MEAVEHVAHLQAVLVGENLLPVKIFVGRDAPLGKQTHDYAEKILLAVDHILREIERGVLGILHLQVAVDDAHPLAVGVAYIRLAGKALLHTRSDTRLRLLLLAAARAVSVAAAAHHR